MEKIRDTKYILRNRLPVKPKEKLLHINHCIVRAGGKNIVALAVDIEEKYCTIAYMGINEGAPLIGIKPKNSTSLDPKVIDITFPEFDDWTVWSAGISRYTLYVCLINDNNLE